jgi:hypothetical protein
LPPTCFSVKSHLPVGLCHSLDVAKWRLTAALWIVKQIGVNREYSSALSGVISLGPTAFLQAARWIR